MIEVYAQPLQERPQMACLGVHFAIEERVAQRLLAAAGDDAKLVEIVREDIEEAWDEEHLFQSDKAWDALHRCLSNGTLNVQEGTPPLSRCFFGGRVLNEEADYFVVLLDPAQVREVAAALSAVTEPWLRDRYFSVEFPDYQVDKSEEDFEYSWGNFQGLPEFFSRAAQEGRWVAFTVDQ